METLLIQSSGHYAKPNISKVLYSSFFTSSTTKSPANPTAAAGSAKMSSSDGGAVDAAAASDAASPIINATYDPASSNGTYWNTSDLLNITTNNSEFLADYDYQMLLNATVVRATSSGDEAWSSCKEWSAAQHSLFQAANFFFAAAFLVPSSFKQSVLLVRSLITVGYAFLIYWAGVEICAPDIMLWYALLVGLNLTHTCLLTWRFLPPTLTLELTDLYLKMFKPLKVSKKHFKELVKEARILNLENGDIYAVEDASPADERLSILLKGKLRVTCDDTHLHFINVHQFVDSPEWEANHEQSDDVFQVTITAEEDSVYLCWSRMKLERFLRHRPMLKTVLDCIIGKDITYKLYSLNEHLSGLSEERIRERRGQMWARTHRRSMSVDAVSTGTTGLVRSNAYARAQKTQNFLSTESIPPGKFHPQNWIPFVASQFPSVSPFTQHHLQHPQQQYQQSSVDSSTSLLRSEQQQHHGTPQRTVANSSLKRNREVKFVK